MQRSEEIYYAYGSLSATIVFLITLSFLVTTPGAWSPASPFNGFLLKDIMLLAGSLVTAAEAFSADYLAESRAGRVRIAA